MFKFINKEMFAHGYYKATCVEIVGKCSRQAVSKSFFPAHWSPEQVMQEIHYAMRNMKLVVENEKNSFDVVVNIFEYLHTLESISKGLTFSRLYHKHPAHSNYFQSQP